MSATWRLARTAQCAKCPWRVATDPREIPNGYCEAKHRALANTIARPGDLSTLGEPVRAMACHETHDAHCVGWLHHQVGVGNNIALRLRLRSCENVHRLRLRGEQHQRFEDTLPRIPKESPEHDVS
jgi:glutamate/tyrosine decarboxylase-like PLP-dependent enzyme